MYKRNEQAIQRGIVRRTVKKMMDSELHDTNNLRAANAVLEDMQRYGGEESALGRWARMAKGRIESAG